MNNDAITQKPTFAIWQIIGDAWRLVKGSKWPIWAIFIVGLLSAVIVSSAITFMLHPQGGVWFVVYRHLILPCIDNAVMAPFLAGTMMVAIKRTRGETVTAASGYAYFARAGNVILISITLVLLANLMICIMQLPIVNKTAGYYPLLHLISLVIALLVYTFCVFAIPLAVDKSLRPLQAMKTSIRIVSSHWVKIVVTFILVGLIGLIPVIPAAVLGLLGPLFFRLGMLIVVIALIWLMPLALLVNATLYHKLID